MEQGRFYKWRQGNGAKIFFLALSFYCVFGFTNVGYLLAVFYAQTGFSSRDAGALVSVFYVASVVSRLLLGCVVPRLGFRRTLLVAAVLSVASSLSIVFAGLNFWMAFFSRLLLGVGSSFFQIGLATFQAVTFNERDRSRAFSLIMAGGLAPMMTVVPLADWLLLRGYGRVYILIPLILCVMAAVVTSSIPGLDDAETNDRVPRESGGLAAFAECARIPALRIALLSMLLFSMTDATAAFMAPMTNSYGLMTSYFLSSNAVIGVCARLFFSKVLDRYPRRRLSSVVVLLMSAALIAASISPTRYSLIVLGLIFGVGMGFGFPLNLALVSDSVPTRLQPPAVSICWFVMGIDFALIPLLTGWLGSLTGPRLAFRLIAVAIFTGAVYMVYLWEKHNERVQKGT